MQFLYGDRELIVSPRDLLEAPVDVIVNSTDVDLLHSEGLSEQISQSAGLHLKQESELLIKEYGAIDTGMVVYTTAGDLPHKAILHVISPRQGDGAEQQTIELLVSRCLKLCEINDWSSIAFPAIGLGKSGVPLDKCAQGFFRSITHFWDARHECNVEKIELCITRNHFDAFFNAFREDAIITDENTIQPQVDSSEDRIGYVDLTDSDVAASNEFDDWFSVNTNGKKTSD